MTVTKPGAVVEYEGVQFSIGAWFEVLEHSDYAGLTGVIVEMTDEEDALDIICNLTPPTDPEVIAALEERFSGYHGGQIRLCDISLEGVVLQPDEIYCMSEKPLCYDPEPDNPYPLCVGNGGRDCEHCAYYIHLDFNKYE